MNNCVIEIAGTSQPLIGYRTVMTIIFVWTWKMWYSGKLRYRLLTHLYIRKNTGNKGIFSYESHDLWLLVTYQQALVRSVTLAAKSGGSHSHRSIFTKKSSLKGYKKGLLNLLRNLAISQVTMGFAVVFVTLAIYWGRLCLIILIKHKWNTSMFHHCAWGLGRSITLSTWVTIVNSNRSCYWP